MLRDTTEILGDVVEQAVRLVRADGVILDLLDPSTGNLHWALDSGVREQFTDEERAQLWISVGVGATGKAVAEDRVVARRRRPRGAVPAVARVDRVLRADRLPVDDRRADHRRDGPARRHRGLLEAARRVHRDGCRPDRRARQPGGDRDHQCAADRRARPLPGPARRDRRGRADPARDRRSRERHARPGRDPPVGHRRGGPPARGERGHDRPDRRQGDGRSLVEPAGRGAHARQRGPARPTSRSTRRSASPGWPSGRGRRPGRATTSTDQRFAHTADRDAFVRASGIHSVLAAPLIHRDDVFGVVNAYADRADAFDETDAGLLAALADQAAIAIANVRLIEELRALALGDRPAGRFGADAARDRGPRVGHPRARTRSSSRSPRRPPASSSRTAPASTSTTRRWTHCAGRTRPATRCRRCRTGPRPAASSRARRSPAWPSPSSARSSPPTTWPTSASTTRRRSTRSSSGCASAR